MDPDERVTNRSSMPSEVSDRARDGETVLLETPASMRSRVPAAIRAASLSSFPDVSNLPLPDVSNSMRSGYAGRSGSVVGSHEGFRTKLMEPVDVTFPLRS